MKKLLFICGPNGIGKTTVCNALCRQLDRSAYVDSDGCRLMNPFVLNDETIPTIRRNISGLLRNYLECPAVDTVIFSYGFHGRRKEIFDGVMHDLAGMDYKFVPILFTCEEDENIRRMQCDSRDVERIRRALESTRTIYRNVDYPSLDITGLSVEDTVLKLIEILHSP